LARENAALSGHVRTLVMTGEALLKCIWVLTPEASDFKAALDAARVAKIT